MELREKRREELAPLYKKAQELLMVWDQKRTKVTYDDWVAAQDAYNEAYYAFYSQGGEQ